MKSCASIARIAVGLVVCLLTSGAVPDELSDTPKKAGPPKLQPVLSDDFKSDTRRDYQIEGDVLWEKGKLTLVEGASITRGFDTGAWIITGLQLSKPIPEEVRLWFRMHGDGASDVVVRLQFTTSTDGVDFVECSFGTSKVLGNDGLAIDNLPTKQIVVSTGSLQIQYRYGALAIESDKHSVARHYVGGNGVAAVSGLTLESVRGSARISLLRAEGDLRRHVITLNQSKSKEMALASATWRKALNAHQQYRRHEAVELGTQAYEAFRGVWGDGDPRTAVILNSLGDLRRFSADYRRAAADLRRSVRTFEQTMGTFHPVTMNGLNNMGAFFWVTGDYNNAIDAFSKARSIYNAFNQQDDASYLTLCHNLASVYLEQERYLDALEIQAEAVDAMRRLPEQHRWMLAEGLSLLAKINLALHRTPGSLALCEEALAVQRSALGEWNSGYARMSAELAMYYSRAGEHDRAKLLLTKSKEITQQTLGENHPNFAFVMYCIAVHYRRTGAPEKAEKCFTQALDIQETHLAGTSPVQSARQQLRSRHELRWHFDDRLSNALTFECSISNVLRDLWQWKGAVTALQRSYRQVAFDADLLSLFTELQSVSRNLSAHSGRIPRPPRDGLASPAWGGYQTERQSWNTRFAELNSRFEELQQLLAAESEEFRQIQEPLTVGQVQQWLPQTTAYIDFLEYNHSELDPNEKGEFRSERRYIAFVVRPDQNPAMAGLGTADDLAAVVTAFRRPFQQGQNTPDNRQKAQAAGRRLRGDLWLPLEKHLDGIDTVIISPDTVLGTLPFAALPGRKEGTYLLEDYRIAMLPMATQLWSLFEDEPPTLDDRGLLIVGDVDYDRSATEPSGMQPDSPLLADASVQREVGRLRSSNAPTFVSLPGFRKELNLVDDLFQTQFNDLPARTLSGSNATESEFLRQAAHARILHVITHGYFADPSVKSIRQAEIKHDGLMSDHKGPDPFINTYMPGLLSGLAMAGANNPSTDPEDPRDGILRASEIEASSMQGVDLVVLSACETGLGKVAGGEGLTGLQRAFQVAGARTVIASLWQVEDSSTTQLIKLFYTNLWKKKMSKLDALREAQLTMLNHYNAATGELRGSFTGKKQTIDPNKPAPKPVRAGKRLDPRYWAAFQLSGDWR